MGKKKKQDNSNTIAQNKKARHDFFIEAPREPEAQRHLAVRLAKAAIDNCPAIL